MVAGITTTYTISGYHR